MLTASSNPHVGLLHNVKQAEGYWVNPQLVRKFTCIDELRSQLVKTAGNTS